MFTSRTQRMPGSYSSRQAFTLIELLVVIGVIITLMGVLIPVAFAALGKGTEAKSQARLNKIEAAIGLFYAQQKTYPLLRADQNNSRSFEGENGFQSRNILLRSELAAADPDGFNEESELVRSLFGEGGSEILILVDAFGENGGNEIYYLPYTFYVTVENAYNPDSFQLWSLGMDEVDNVLIDPSGGSRSAASVNDYDGSDISAIPYGDDLVNWNWQN